MEKNDWDFLFMIVIAVVSYIAGILTEKAVRNRMSDAIEL